VGDVRIGFQRATAVEEREFLDGEGRPIELSLEYGLVLQGIAIHSWWTERMESDFDSIGKTPLHKKSTACSVSLSVNHAVTRHMPVKVRKAQLVFV